MKKTNLYISLLTFSLLFVFACKKGDDLKDVAVRIDIQSSFVADDVKIYIDNQKEFDNTITTNDVLSFAGGFSTVKSEGRHHLRVIIGGVEYNENFTLSNMLYIGINYDRQLKQVKTIHSATPFGYD
jgi:hypothetical protein